jgi:hypothetical protein
MRLFDLTREALCPVAVLRQREISSPGRPTMDTEARVAAASGRGERLQISPLIRQM